MKTVVQRVREASVLVSGQTVGAIGRGAMLLVGVEKGDTEVDVDVTARKVAALRFFPGRTPMDATLGEVDGGVLVVSQFTLAASLTKGNRPSFEPAEAPQVAERLYEALVAALQAFGLMVQTGRFGADMQVSLTNDGPVTFLVFTRDGKLLKD